MTVTRDLSGGDNKMRKILMVGIMTFALITTAGLSCASSVVSTEIHGNNVEFDIYTRMTHLDGDHFHGEGEVLDAWQTSRVGASGQWTSDGADIDRYGEFSGGGLLSIYSEHNSKAQWSPAHSEHMAWIESDGTGWLGQNTHWDSNFGGVKDVDPWKKQRTMEMGAGSDYDMGYTAIDLRNDNWEFMFSASGDGDANLFVDNAYATVEHGSGQWYTPDDYHTDWEFDWTGDLTQDTYANGERGVDFEEYKDLVDGFIFGNAIIW